MILFLLALEVPLFLFSFFPYLGGMWRKSLLFFFEIVLVEMKKVRSRYDGKLFFFPFPFPVLRKLMIEVRRLPEREE